MKFKLLSFLLIVGLAGGYWLATTSHPNIWPIRNTLKYHALQNWWAVIGLPPTTGTGTIQGVIQNEQGEPIEQAWILLTLWDGTTISHYTDTTGQYRLENVPAGQHQLIATAPNYANHILDNITIHDNTAITVPVTLSQEQKTNLISGSNLTLSTPTQLTCDTLFTVTANRRYVQFNNVDQPNSLTLFYSPITATQTSTLPILLTVYPGPADSWECVSIALSQAGYAVVAVGPAYSFDVENQVDELERLINFAQAETLPYSDGAKIALLGGSFSSIHVQRLIQRRQDIQAALLLGPPTDMFDLRHRFEAGEIMPPFGLDQIMIAGGLPTDELLRYWQYSAAYHVRSDLPPQAILHSRTDDVVPFQQSEILAQHLKMVNVPHETHFFEGASHYLMAEGGDKDTLEVYRITLDFLKKQLN